MTQLIKSQELIHLVCKVLHKRQDRLKTQTISTNDTKQWQSKVHDTQVNTDATLTVHNILALLMHFLEFWY